MMSRNELRMEVIDSREVIETLEKAARCMHENMTSSKGVYNCSDCGYMWRDR